MKLGLGLVEASLIGAICIILFYIISGKFGSRYHQKYKMVVWILIAVRLLIPVHIDLGEPAAVITIPEYILEASDVGDKKDVSSLTENAEHGPTIVSKPINQGRIPIGHSIIRIWFLGACLFGMYYFMMYINGMKRLERNSYPCTLEHILEIRKQTAMVYKMKRVPDIRMMMNGKTSPFTMGLMSSTIYLPNTDYKEKELMYIMRHEMLHCKRRDVLTKIFFLAVNAIHWFNPAVWLMRRLVNQDIELVCDEEVLRDATKEERRAYSELIMAYIETDETKKPVVSTGYVQGISFIKKRFANIFDTKRKRCGALGVVCIAGALLLISVGVQITTSEIGENSKVDNVGKVMTFLEAYKESNIASFQDLIWGKKTVVEGIDKYGQLDDYNGIGELNIFPQGIEFSSESAYYYEQQDTIFSAECQIYLKAKYFDETYEMEVSRLKAMQKERSGVTNYIKIDNENFCDTAYVAIGNWRHCWEYAIAIESEKTIVYVYLQNPADLEKIYMNKVYMPQNMDLEEFNMYVFGQ